MEEIKREWYVVNTYAGHENKVKENLQRRIDTMNLQDYLFQIIVAEEKEIEFKNGKKVEKTYKPFPGAEDEMESILRRLGIRETKVQIDFAVGDRVKILTGAFQGVEGSVEALNDETQIATVLTILFGRETPTEISYGDLEKIEF